MRSPVPSSLTAGPGSEYDSFADIYTRSTDTAESTRANLAFYSDAYTTADGPVVELGIGDGRIAVDAATRGCDVIGVDASSAMLALCRQRAQRTGVTDKITLLEADFREFALAEPAKLIALPYHSIGHLLTLDDKRQAMRQVFAQLRPGGRFIFDDFLMTPALVAHMRQVQLRDPPWVLWTPKKARECAGRCSWAHGSDDGSPRRSSRSRCGSVCGTIAALGRWLGSWT